MTGIRGASGSATVSSRPRKVPDGCLCFDSLPALLAMSKGQYDRIVETGVLQVKGERYRVTPEKRVVREDLADVDDPTQTSRQIMAALEVRDPDRSLAAPGKNGWSALQYDVSLGPVGLTNNHALHIPDAHTGEFGADGVLCDATMSVDELDAIQKHFDRIAARHYPPTSPTRDRPVVLASLDDVLDDVQEQVTSSFDGTEDNLRALFDQVVALGQFDDHSDTAPAEDVRGEAVLWQERRDAMMLCIIALRYAARRAQGGKADAADALRVLAAMREEGLCHGDLGATDFKSANADSSSKAQKSSEAPEAPSAFDSETRGAVLDAARILASTDMGLRILCTLLKRNDTVDPDRHRDAVRDFVQACDFLVMHHSASLPGIGHVGAWELHDIACRYTDVLKNTRLERPPTWLAMTALRAAARILDGKETTLDSTQKFSLMMWRQGCRAYGPGTLTERIMTEFASVIGTLGDEERRAARSEMPWYVRLVRAFFEKYTALSAMAYGFMGADAEHITTDARDYHDALGRAQQGLAHCLKRAAGVCDADTSLVARAELAAQTALVALRLDADNELALSAQLREVRTGKAPLVLNADHADHADRLAMANMALDALECAYAGDERNAEELLRKLKALHGIGYGEEAIRRQIAATAYRYTGQGNQSTVTCNMRMRCAVRAAVLEEWNACTVQGGRSRLELDDARRGVIVARVRAWGGPWDDQAVRDELKNYTVLDFDAMKDFDQDLTALADDARYALPGTPGEDDSLAAKKMRVFRAGVEMARAARDGNVTVPTNLGIDAMNQAVQQFFNPPETRRPILGNSVTFTLGKTYSLKVSPSISAPQIGASGSITPAVGAAHTRIASVTVGSTTSGGGQLIFLSGANRSARAGVALSAGGGVDIGLARAGASASVGAAASRDSTSQSGLILRMPARMTPPEERAAGSPRYTKSWRDIAGVYDFLTQQAKSAASNPRFNVEAMLTALAETYYDSDLSFSLTERSSQSISVAGTVSAGVQATALQVGATPGVAVTYQATPHIETLNKDLTGHVRTIVHSVGQASEARANASLSTAMPGHLDMASMGGTGTPGASAGGASLVLGSSGVACTQIVLMNADTINREFTFRDVTFRDFATFERYVNTGRQDWEGRFGKAELDKTMRHMQAVTPMRFNQNFVARQRITEAAANELNRRGALLHALERTAGCAGSPQLAARAQLVDECNRIMRDPASWENMALFASETNVRKVAKGGEYIVGLFETHVASGSREMFWFAEPKNNFAPNDSDRSAPPTPTARPTPKPTYGGSASGDLRALQPCGRRSDIVVAEE